MSPEKFKNNFEHAKISLSNVQETIRFIDTKVAGAMGFVAVVLGFAISRETLARQLCAKKDIPLWAASVEWVLLGISLVLLILAIKEAKDTLSPRVQPIEKSKDTIWTLFPLTTSIDENELNGTLHSRMTKGMDEDDILTEYADQLTINGYVQTEKMRHCERMFRHVWLFSVAMCILGAISLSFHAWFETPDFREKLCEAIGARCDGNKTQEPADINNSRKSEPKCDAAEPAHSFAASTPSATT